MAYDEVTGLGMRRQLHAIRHILYGMWLPVIHTY